MFIKICSDIILKLTYICLGKKRNQVMKNFCNGGILTFATWAAKLVGIQELIVNLEVHGLIAK